MALPPKTRPSTSAQLLTSSKEIKLRVYGRPAPQGSKRSLGNGVMIESSKHVKPWRTDVKEAAREQIKCHTLDVPVMLNITFLFDRPKSHYRTGKNAHLLRDGASDWVVAKNRGDLSKLVRSTEDALSVSSGGSVITDDSLIAKTLAMKVYCMEGEEPGAIIRIKVLPNLRALP